MIHIISKICGLCVLFQFVSSYLLYINKKCPVVAPVPKLDWKGLSGMWYQQARYDNDYEMKNHCDFVHLMTEKNMFNITEMGDPPYSFGGPLRPASNGTGVIFFHSSFHKKMDHSEDMPVAVLALDVNNYAVMYDCKYDEKTKKRHDYLWILSRFKTFEGETKAFVDDFLDRTPFLDKSKILWQDFSLKSCNL